MAQTDVRHAPEGLGGMHQIRLLVAFDALLREGSVSRAAAGMGLQVSAMSRLLGSLRDLYNDPILVRTGQGMRPTPFAESMRLRIRALAAEAQNLLQIGNRPGQEQTSQPDTSWQHPALLEAPPLSVMPADALEEAPQPDHLAHRLAAIGDNADPHRRLAKYIAIIAPGPGKSRPLDMEEAADALSIILEGQADPVQIGAFLMTMQYRGITAPELAGFAQAIQRHCGASAMMQGGNLVDLDWPAYLSPRIRTAPWFIHSARLVARAGYRVLLHGHFGTGPESGKLETAAQDAGIPVCLSVAEAAQALRQNMIAYMPLGALSSQVLRILGLHSMLEMRNPLHLAVHLSNPLGAPASLLGASQFSSRDIYRDAVKLMGQQDLAVLGNTRDFAQFTPFRATWIYRLAKGMDADILVPARPQPQPEKHTLFSQREYWMAVWTGAARDEQAEAIIISTAAAALLCLSRDPEARFEDALQTAANLWATRKDQ